MSRAGLRRRLRVDEGGVVAVVVAICMIVLMGMLVLTVDLGRTVSIRRDMVNASDAAVLAAARTCAIGGGYEGAVIAATELIDEKAANLGRRS
jgi:Flp pilus assembly protein TadG